MLGRCQVSSSACSAHLDSFACSGMVTAARLQQLEADRARTRAISMYLKDHRARFEGQLVGSVTKSEKRQELLRIARISFAQLPSSLQNKYLIRAGSELEEVNLDSVATGGVGESGCVSGQSGEVGSASGSEVKRRRLRGKQGQHQQQPFGQQCVVVSGSSPARVLPPHTPEPRKSVSSTEEAEFKSQPSKLEETESVQEAQETVPEQRRPVRSSPAPLQLGHACGVGESGCVSGQLKTSLPNCLPRLVKVAGHARACDIMASAWRFLDRYPQVLQTSDALAVRLAVLLGVAAKLTQQSNAIDVVKVWHAFAPKSLEPRVRSLEVELVNAFGREGLQSQCS